MQLHEAKFEHILTRGAVASVQSSTGFVWNQAFNMINVEGDKFTYKYYANKELSTDDVTERNVYDDYKRISHAVNTLTGECKDYGLETPVPYKILKELGGDVLQAEANILMNKGNVRAEKLAYAAFFTDGVFTTEDQTATWDDTNVNPIDIVMDEIEEIARETGVRPNSITTFSDVALKLRKSDAIRDLLPTDTTRTIANADLARLFGVDYFNVSTAISNATKTTAGALIGSNRMLIHHKTNQDPRFTPCSALIAVSNTAEDIVGTSGMGIKSYDEIQKNSKIIRLDMNMALVIPASYTGRLLKNLY